MALELDKTEIIKCRHGKIFAACVVGWEDDEWKANKKKYQANGCKAETIPSKGVKLESCDCDPNKPPDIQIKIEF